MDLKCVVAILLYIHLTWAIHVNTNNFPNSEEDSYGEDHIEQQDIQREVNTKNRSPIKIEPRYEVTETIIDIPNTTPPPGIANASYAIHKPLNHANPTNPNGDKAEDGLSEDEKMYKELINNYYSILQVIETHHKDDHEEMIDLPQFLNDFKDYLEGLREGFVHGIHDIRREVESEVEDSDVHQFLSGPLLYIKKLFKRRN